MFSQKLQYKFHWAYFMEHPKPQLYSLQAESAANTLSVKGRIRFHLKGMSFPTKKSEWIRLYMEYGLEIKILHGI